MTRALVFSITLSLFLCTVPVCYTIRISRRMVGGRSVNVGDSPFQVSIQYISTWKHLCGGSIIDERHVISAAHCVYKLPVSEICVAAGLVRLSDPHQKRHSVAEVYVHKKFRLSLMNDNIAILKIKSRFNFEVSKVEYITFPTSPVSPGTAVRAFGWGLSEVEPHRLPDVLQEIDATTLDLSDCALRYRNTTRTSLEVRKGMLCAGDASGEQFACVGDGGGALVNHNGKLVGVASLENNGCGPPNLPGIYTDTYKYRHWISDTLRSSRSSSSLPFSRFSVTHGCLPLLYFCIHGT